MHTEPTPAIVLWAKGLLTWTALSLVAGLAAADLAPDWPWWRAPLWAAAGLLLLLAAVWAAVRVLAPLHQWVLRHGGIDVPWLSLPAEPCTHERPEDKRPPR